jgi:hypothetical protein
MWNLISIRLEIVLVSVQDWCMVCAKHTIGVSIILDTLEEHLGDVGHVESYFDPFGDSVSIGSRLVHGLEIILDAPDGTPR